MEIVEVKCENCGKEIYVRESSVREEMFCTLACLSSYNGASHSKSRMSR